MVLVQIGLFFIFFLDNLGQENMLNDIPERKNTFAGYKKKEVPKVEKLRFFQTG